MNRFLIVLASALLSLAVHSQTMTKEAAKQMGGDLGTSLNPNIYNGLKGGNPTDLVPKYNSNPEQKQYFQGGNGATVTPGTQRVSQCASQSDVECQAVNLLQQGPVTRPQIELKRTDPLFGRVKSLTTSPTGQVGDIFSSYDTCKTTTTTTPPTFETQVCNEFSSLENKTCKMGREVIVDPDYLYKCLETIQSQSNATCNVGRVIVVDVDYNYQCQITRKVDSYKCRRGFSPEIGVQIQSQDYSVNRGSEVPTWTATTFDMNLDLIGDPESFNITYYRVDNYGQVWVNGVKVIENTLQSSWSDMRWGSVKTVLSCGDEWCSYDTAFYDKNGTRLSSFWDDGCNWGCRGASVNINIAPYLRKGANTITLVCANANGIGPCQINASGSVRVPVFIGSLVNNQCDSLEQRSR